MRVKQQWPPFAAPALRPNSSRLVLKFKRQETEQRNQNPMNTNASANSDSILLAFG